MKQRIGQIASGAIACACWSALGLQFYLIAAATEATGDGWWLGASRYFGFFTILTNLLVATVLSAPLFPQRLGSWLSSVNVKSATATYIAMVGIVYTLVLRSLWDPQGLQRVADVVLHDVVPVSYVLYWVVFVEKGSLRWSDAARWLIYPALYLVYAMVRGAVSGWYPYPFLDAGQLGYAQVSLNALGLITLFAALGLIVVGVDRALARTSRTVIACLLVCACDSPPPPEPQPRERVRRESAPFVGKVWASTDASAAAGTLRIFLPDGTLVMDSCWETYQLAEWRLIDEDRIEWREGTARIEAHVTQIAAEQLHLTLQLAGGVTVETYQVARSPFVCPDLPR